jgi:hypothetical protein
MRWKVIAPHGGLTFPVLEIWERSALCGWRRIETWNNPLWSEVVQYAPVEWGVLE